MAVAEGGGGEQQTYLGGAVAVAGEKAMVGVFRGMAGRGRRTGGGGGWDRAVRQGIAERSGRGWRRQAVRLVQDRAVHADRKSVV